MEGFREAHFDIALEAENKTIGSNVKRLPDGDGNDPLSGSNAQIFKVGKGKS